MRLASLAFALLILPALAQAQSAGPPTYTAGDQWTYSTGGTVKVVSADGDTVVMTGLNRNCMTCLYHYTPTLTLIKVTDAQGNAVDSTTLGFLPLGNDWKYYDFPLEPGKSWRISAQGLFRQSLIRYTVDLKVAALEDVKTAAGTFKAYKILRNWTIETFARNRPQWSQAVWFSPDARAVVKFTTTQQGQNDFELTAYSLK
jgi:hypothetical protein